MKTIFLTLKETLQNSDAVLVQIVADSGSTPRGSGAAMVMGPTGRLAGTIGGGAVEYKAEQLARQLLVNRENLLSEFSLNEKDIQDLGMICGGDVRVYFRFIEKQDEKVLSLLDQGISAFIKGKKSWLFLNIKNGDLAIYLDGETATPWQISKEELAEFLRVKPITKDQIYAQPLSKGGKVLIFGGGHVAQELVPFLQRIDFNCHVFDDRPEFLTKELFPLAEKLILGDFNQIYDKIELSEDDYAIVMTRGHAFDLIVQRQLHKVPLAYLGIIGSRKKMARVFAQLEEEGISKDELAKVHTPIGLPILADTPAEIGVSIAAELILHRAKLREIS